MTDPLHPSNPSGLPAYSIGFTRHMKPTNRLRWRKPGSGFGVHISECLEQAWTDDAGAILEWRRLDIVDFTAPSTEHAYG